MTVQTPKVLAITTDLVAAWAVDFDRGVIYECEDGAEEQQGLGSFLASHVPIYRFDEKEKAS